MKHFCLGLVLGVLVLPLSVFGYFKLGSPPVATADPPLPFEKQIVRVPLDARIDREKPKTVPLAADEAAYVAGAAVYHAQCAACHGLPDHGSTFAKGMFPPAATSGPLRISWNSACTAAPGRRSVPDHEQGVSKIQTGRVRARGEFPRHDQRPGDQ